MKPDTTRRQLLAIALDLTTPAEPMTGYRLEGISEIGSQGEYFVFQNRDSGQWSYFGLPIDYDEFEENPETWGNFLNKTVPGGLLFRLPAQPAFVARVSQ